MRHTVTTLAVLSALAVGFFAHSLVPAARAEPAPAARTASCEQFANLRNQRSLEAWMNEQLAAGKTDMLVPSAGVVCAW